MSARALGPPDSIPGAWERSLGSTQPASDHQANRRRELAHRLRLGYGFSESHFQNGAERYAAEATWGQGIREPTARWAVPLWKA